LFNLLINARKAIADKSGWITIRADRVADDKVSLTVADSGCGIPDDLVDHIFEPFVTSRNGNGARRQSGLGLGLAVCRDIVRENGGCISVESEVGAGTKFTLILPAGQ
jgi:signal transduction histidine kinase